MNTVNQPILYQHNDGRYGLSFGPAQFAVGDPAWHRVPLDVVEGGMPAASEAGTVYVDAGHLREVTNGNDMPVSMSTTPAHGMVALREASEAGAVPIGYISLQAFENFKSCGQDTLETFHSPGALRDEFEDAIPMPVYAAPPAPVEAGYRRVPQAYIDAVDGAAKIACKYSPCIDAVDEAGGDDAEDPTWAIHHRLYYAGLMLAAPSDAPAQRECNACEWKGGESDCVMLGSIGPLCPKCRGTTDAPAQEEPEWIDDPHDINQEMMRNPKYVPPAPAAQQVERCKKCGGAKVGATPLLTGTCQCAPAAQGDERAALETLIREAQAVADDHHRPRYTRLDEAIQTARAALARQPSAESEPGSYFAGPMQYVEKSEPRDDDWCVGQRGNGMMVPGGIDKDNAIMIAAALNRQPSAGDGERLSDDECIEVYHALDEFGRNVDHYEYGLPMLGVDDRQAEALQTIRAAINAARAQRAEGGSDGA